MANKILKTLTLPNAQGEPVTYELHPEWDNIEGKPESFGSKGNGIFYIEGTQGASKNDWLGTHADITEYYSGLVVAYKIPTSGGSAGDLMVLNINSLGYRAVVANNNTDISYNYPSGSVLILVYTVDNGTGYWKIYEKDTMNTAGTAPVSSKKLYLVGSDIQASPNSTGAYPTNTNSKVYIGTDNCLYSNSKKVATIDEELITIDEIDEICGASIVTASEVTF